jgi:two-component system nitrate/nitrite response regulator NarL
MERLSVLLVDDDPGFLQIAAEFLQGFDEIDVVDTANGGQAAIDAARELQPQVILIDLIMPDVSGLDALPCLRALLPGAVIIALSVATTSGYRQAALAAGADHFIPKRNLDSGLLPAIRRLAQARGGPVLEN